MKKYLLSLLSCLALTVNAQIECEYQLTNPDFEFDWESETEPGTDWHSFESCVGDIDVINLGKSGSPRPSKVEGRNGGYGIKIYSKNVALVAKANGNLTTGYINMGSTTATSTDNHNVSRVSEGLAMSFEGKPDAVGFWAKFQPGYSTSGVIKKKYTYYEKARARFIIHDESIDYHDPEPSGQEDDYKTHRIAESIIPITSTAVISSTATSGQRTYSSEGNWKYFEAPFEYFDSEKEDNTKYLLASFTTNSTPGESENDFLWIDDVYFIYYSTLSSLTYDGEELLSGSETGSTIQLDCSSKEYTKSKLATVLKGRGAKIQSSTYSSTTGILTITVRGNDYSPSNKNQTIYKIQFAKPGSGKLSDLQVNGTTVEGFDKSSFYYTIEGEYTEGCITYTQEDGEFAQTNVTYDAANRIATVVTTANIGGARNSYYIKFAKATTAYTGKMIITMDGNLLAVKEDPVGISNPVEGKADFQLRNFYLEGMGLIGDVYVTDVPYVPNADGSVTLNKTQDIVIFGATGTTLGTLPITLTGEVREKKLTATIHITWNDGTKDVPIVVDMYPYDASTIDMSASLGAGAAIALTRENMTNENLVIYIGSEEEVSKEENYNVIKGSTCAKLVVNDAYEFSVPNDFTATTVTYDRTLTAGNKATFVLPFGFIPAEGDVVAELSEQNGTNLVFKPVTETEANKPYVIQTHNADALKKFHNVEVKATTDATLTTAITGFTHTGTYKTMTGVKGYGYTGGKFVQTNNGTLKPFRTYIAATDGSLTNTFEITLEGEETGIEGVESDSNITAIYNLQGVRVGNSLQGLAKGVYIVNGKKTIVK